MVRHIDDAEPPVRQRGEEGALVRDRRFEKVIKRAHPVACDNEKVPVVAVYRDEQVANFTGVRVSPPGEVESAHCVAPSERVVSCASTCAASDSSATQPSIAHFTRMTNLDTPWSATASPRRSSSGSSPLPRE